MITEERELVEVKVWCRGRATLVLPRSHLSLYRATVDGEPAPTRIANLSRLAVEVPPGEHSVRVWIDRRSFHLAFLGWPLAALLVVVAARLRGRTATPALDTLVEADGESGGAEAG